MITMPDTCDRCGNASPVEDGPELDGSRFGMCASCIAELVEHRLPDPPPPTVEPRRPPAVGIHGPGRGAEVIENPVKPAYQRLNRRVFVP